MLVALHRLSVKQNLNVNIKKRSMHRLCYAVMLVTINGISGNQVNRQSHSYFVVKKSNKC